MMMAMTDRDKAFEYDRIARYLRENGWRVVKCVKRVPSGSMAEMWSHPTHGKAIYNLASAFRVECLTPRTLVDGEEKAEEVAG